MLQFHVILETVYIVYIKHECLKIVLCHMNFRFHCFPCFDLFHISKKYRHIMFKLIEILEEFCDYLLLLIRKVYICHIRDIIRMLQEFMSEKKSLTAHFFWNSSRILWILVGKGADFAFCCRVFFFLKRLSFKVFLLLCNRLSWLLGFFDHLPPYIDIFYL